VRYSLHQLINCSYNPVTMILTCTRSHFVVRWW